MLMRLQSCMWLHVYACMQPACALIRPQVMFTVWDVGGQEKLRPLWRHYFQVRVQDFFHVIGLPAIHYVGFLDSSCPPML